MLGLVLYLEDCDHEMGILRLSRNSKIAASTTNSNGKDAPRKKKKKSKKNKRKKNTQFFCLFVCVELLVCGIYKYIEWYFYIYIFFSASKSEMSTDG